MPIYEYECLSCGKRTEVLQKMNDAPLAACPNCGGEVKKLISAPAFQLKGSGWYATDYGGKKGGGGASEKSESKSEAKTESKSESKPEKAAVSESKGSGGGGSE
ncbi:MAG TPA: FmdB family zinc ribbon protein [Thermoanaerobaculia bacterium]|jgi:putative FmdB family regulatory protein